MNDSERGRIAEEKAKELGAAIRKACSSEYGALSSSFLCTSVGTLDPPEPLCVTKNESIQDVLELLRDNRIGSVIIVDAENKLTGIFTERDCILKLFKDGVDLAAPIATVMTADPVSQTMDSTIAYVLNLMSHGGFFWLPSTDFSLSSSFCIFARYGASSRSTRAGCST